MNREDEAPAAPDSKDLTVFIIRKPSVCAECSAELGKGTFIRVEKERGLCLECADLDHLAWLPRGDAALTRRARKHSGLSAVVVEWSRARKRYERQGVLVEEEALERAEAECEADADERAARRQRARLREAELDQVYMAEFTRRILIDFPRCLRETAGLIAKHACRKHSGRVGRSAAAKEFDPETIVLAVRAHIRHTCTNYDDMLARGMARREARMEVADDVDRICRKWRGEQREER